MAGTTNVVLVTDPTVPVDVPDTELVLRVAKGDRSALDELYGRHARWLSVRLSRRCGDTDVVDTAVQDTFLAVWKQADRYKPTGEVGAWIWTIGIRRLIDQMRRRPPPTPIPESALFGRVLVEEVPLALAHGPLGQAFFSLDHDLQAVLAATALDGLSNREAAQLLNIPIGTVKSRLSRARSILKEVIA